MMIAYYFNNYKYTVIDAQIIRMSVPIHISGIMTITRDPVLEDAPEV